MIALLLFLTPWCDPWDYADWLRDGGHHEEEVIARACIGTEDPLDAYNLVVALAEGGHAVGISALYDCAARIPPWDPMLANVLDVLADEADEEDESRLLSEHAQALRVLNGR